MPGRSAVDRPPPDDRDAAGPADRLSLTVSGLLIAGLSLAVTALYQNAGIHRPKPPQPAQPPPALTARQSGSAAAVIRLPPPPAPQPAARGKLLKPAKRPVEKPSAVVPLKRSADITPAPVAARTSPPPIEPLAPAPRPVARHVPQPNSAPALAATTTSSSETEEKLVDGMQNAKAGGALLRLLEHGQGPAIEIAWPQRADARRALYRQLTRCYGVRTAVLAGGAGLYADEGAAGQPWRMDMDRFSGFIRSPQGEAIAEESRVFARIADWHGLTNWRPVRVFPRPVDAALLGGLGAVLGPRYKTARQIHAAYKWDRTRLVLGDFSVDGRPLEGAVTLPLPHRPGCD